MTARPGDLRLHEEDAPAAASDETLVRVSSFRRRDRPTLPLTVLRNGAMVDVIAVPIELERVLDKRTSHSPGLGDVTIGPTRRHLACCPDRRAMAEAFFWGMLGSDSLVLGAVVVSVNMPAARTLGLIMGFGSGVLISAVAFELVEEAASVASGLAATTIGFAAAFVISWAS